MKNIILLSKLSNMNRFFQDINKYFSDKFLFLLLTNYITPSYKSAKIKNITSN